MPSRAGLAAVSCAAAARNGRYVVVVDEDIDPDRPKEVLWAMMTRVDPATNIDIIDGCWSTPLDPRMPPEKRENRDHTNSRGIFYAVRPFEWRDNVSKSEPLQPRAASKDHRQVQGNNPVSWGLKKGNSCDLEVRLRVNAMGVTGLVLNSPSVPLFQRGNFLRRNLTPLWKRGEGEIFGGMGRELLANFRDRTLK